MADSVLPMIFSVGKYEFPYNYKFPGQASDERILFVTRENASMLWWRRFQLLSMSLALVVVAGIARSAVSPYSPEFAQSVWLFLILGAFALLAIGWWWVTTLWRKSVFILTTKRLTKFIYTTPFNRHNLSLPLEMLVDTGSYTKGLIQAFFRLGTFTARSSAASSGVATADTDRVNKKYFYVENIACAEDLQHYVSKLLQALRKQEEKLATFRPFLPNLKGQERKKFMEQFPEYWS